MKNLVTISSSPAHLEWRVVLRMDSKPHAHYPSTMRYILNLKDPAIGLALLLVSVQVNVCF